MIIANGYDVSFTLEPLGGKDVSAVMREVSRNVAGTYWLSAGTLLGLRREGGFMPHDTDIDIGVLGGYCEINMPPEYVLFRTIDVNNKRMQECYIEPKQNIIVDFMYYYPTSDSSVLYNESEEGKIYRPLKLVLPAKLLFHNGYPYPVPSKVDEYLEAWYGDWTKKDEGFKTRWIKE